MSSIAAMVGGPNFVSGDVTANGCEVLDGNPNRPQAIGGLLADLCAANNTVVVDFWPLGDGASSQPNVMFVCDDPDTQTSAYVVYMQFASTAGARSGDTLYEAIGYFADWNNGNFNGTYNGLPEAQNVAVGSFQSDGIHDLFNIPSDGVDFDAGGLLVGLAHAFIGYIPDGLAFDGVLNGYIRSITVYPLQADAGVVAIGQTAPVIPLAIGVEVDQATVYPGDQVGVNWGGIGGVQPYTYDVEAGALPHGVTLASRQTSVFTSGATDTTQTTSATVRVTDAASTQVEAAPVDFTVNRVWIALDSLGPQTWTVPANWNSADNLVWAIGGGGGSIQTSRFDSAGGGGGGAYAEKHNFAASGGDTINLQVGSPTTAVKGTAGSPADQDTWFSDAATVLYAQGGGKASGATAGPAGLSSASVGANKHSGGAGGTGGPTRGGAGGGGSGGPNGDGADGGSSPNGALGGSGGGAPDGGTAGAAGVGTTGGDGGSRGLNPGAAGGVVDNPGADATANSGVGGGGGGGTSTADTNTRGGVGAGYDLVNDEAPYNGYGPSGGGGGGGAGVTPFINNGAPGGFVGGGVGGTGLNSTSSLSSADGSGGLIGITYAAIPA